MLIEIIFLQEFSKDLSSNPHQLPTKVILIRRIGFFFKKKSSWINLHHLYSIFIFIFIFFTFLIMNKSSYFKKKTKKKISKKALGLGALDSYFLGFFQKIFKIFNSLKKFKIFQKKKNPNFQFLEKIQDFQIFQKNKNKKNFQFLLKI